MCIFVDVQLLTQLFAAPWTAACQASLSLTISQSLPKFMCTESVMLSNHLILCCPLLLLPSIFPSIRIFSNQLALHIRWPKYWSFSFSISPSNEYSGLISFRVDWLDLLMVQGTLKSLLQHRSSSTESPATGPLEFRLSCPRTGFCEIPAALSDPGKLWVSGSAWQCLQFREQCSPLWPYFSDGSTKSC